MAFSFSDWIAGGQLSDELQIGLYANVLDDSAPLTWTMIQECNFPGYARRRGDIWEPAVARGEGGPAIRSRWVSWVAREPSANSPARGLFVVALDQQGSIELVAVRPFPSEISFDAAGRRYGCRVYLHGFQYTVSA